MKTHKILRVGIIGCGFIGKKRARWIREDPRSELHVVVDSNIDSAENLAREYQCRASADWKAVVKNPELNAVIVSTPNHLLCKIACEAMKNGKHVLIEKPMGRNLSEARKMVLASTKFGRKLKIGFNHRYHPGIFEMHKIIESGKIGKVINLRSHYGHGGREGYEKEWRGNFRLAGGGELTDQGVHLIDLMNWICGEPKAVSSMLQTAFWKIKPSEDNGFALLKYKTGAIGSFHSSWTQWKNAFVFEAFGEKGFVSINGLGGSYGAETLTLGLRDKPGQVPKITQQSFMGEDLSWKMEWEDFGSWVLDNKPALGQAKEGLGVMKVLNALYRSNRSGRAIALN